MAHDHVPGSFEWAFILSNGLRQAPYRLGSMPLVGQTGLAVRGNRRYLQHPLSSMHTETMGHAMKILIADDHRLVIEAVKAKLSEL
jgi:hypothetical protein